MTHDPSVDPRLCDISQGDQQCPYRLPCNGRWAYLCCALKRGHEGEHRTGYAEPDEPTEGWYLG